MGLRMDGFHNYFRMEYKAIYELASRFEEEHMSLREFLQTAKGLHSREWGSTSHIAQFDNCTNVMAQT